MSKRAVITSEDIILVSNVGKGTWKKQVPLLGGRKIFRKSKTKKIIDYTYAKEEKDGGKEN